MTTTRPSSIICPPERYKAEGVNRVRMFCSFPPSSVSRLNALSAGLPKDRFVRRAREEPLGANAQGTSRLAITALSARERGWITPIRLGQPERCAMPDQPLRPVRGRRQRVVPQEINDDGYIPQLRHEWHSP
jgi:hypothetical protein